MRAPSSYHPPLVEAIHRWLPSQFFARWPLRRGLLWVPQRLVWVALLMAWSAEQTLAERFAAALDLLAVLLPRWRRWRGNWPGRCGTATPGREVRRPAIGPLRSG